jgi:hypothetical protein
MRKIVMLVVCPAVGILLWMQTAAAQSQFNNSGGLQAKDPGVRAGNVNAVSRFRR